MDMKSISCLPALIQISRSIVRANELDRLGHCLARCAPDASATCCRLGAAGTRTRPHAGPIKATRCFYRPAELLSLIEGLRKRLELGRSVGRSRPLVEWASLAALSLRPNELGARDALAGRSGKCSRRRPCAQLSLYYIPMSQQH